MDTLVWILLATVVNGLVALAGAATLVMKKKSFESIIGLLVAFSTGTLLSGAFFHLISESAEELTLEVALVYVVFGFSLFFILERVLQWHHCHEGKCDVHPMTYLILIGDGIHNFIDGVVIAASFIVNIPLGILTTFMILSHEIPQELGDFAVLVRGGFGRKKALAYNLLSQATCVLGGIAGFFAAGLFSSMSPVLAFAAGGFIYISASDLIPELHKEKKLSNAVNSFAVFLVGVLFMFATKYFLGE